jgi:hypothetical protein
MIVIVILLLSTEVIRKNCMSCHMTELISQENMAFRCPQNVPFISSQQLCDNERFLHVIAALKNVNSVSQVKRVKQRAFTATATSVIQVVVKNTEISAHNLRSCDMSAETRREGPISIPNPVSSH